MNKDSSKPVVWVRLGKSMGEDTWWYCKSDGTYPKYGPCAAVNTLDVDDVVRNVHEHFRTHYDFRGDLIEVREWQEPKKFCFSSEGELKGALDALIANVKCGSMTGREASLAKWDAVIQFVEEHDIVPRAAIWWTTCGLCVATRKINHRSPCSVCQLGPLVQRSGFDGNLRSMVCSGVESWLEAARKFRTWIYERTSKPKVETKCEPEWVYAVYKSPGFTGGYTPFAGKFMQSSEEVTVEEAIPYLLRGKIVGNNRPTDNEYATSPIFGVRRLTVEECRKASNRTMDDSFAKGVADEGRWAAFYNSEIICGTYTGNFCGPERESSSAEGCVKQVIKMLTPAKNAVTLADLPTA